MSNQYERYMFENLDFKNHLNTYNNTNSQNRLQYIENDNIYSDYNNTYNKFSNENMILKKSYPKIYNEILPYINRICDKYENEELSDNLINKMSGEVYGEIINNVTRENNNNNNKNNNYSNLENSLRGGKNNFLADLISIILIDQLISNCKNGKGNCYKKMAPMSTSMPPPYPPPHYPYCDYNGKCGFDNKYPYYNRYNMKNEIFF